MRGTTHSALSKDTLAGCLRGNAAAQRRLYEQYYGYAFTVCMAYAPHRDAAEEMVQDAFVRVFQRIHQFEGMHFKPWFRRVTVNCAIDHLRKYKEKIVCAEPPTEITGSKADNAALDRLSHEECLRLLQLIPRSYRLVFNLFVLEEYTHQEIAEELGISVGTSKSNLSAARAKLRSLARPYFLPENNDYV